jgi:hypothetical protein
VQSPEVMMSVTLKKGILESVMNHMIARPPLKMCFNPGLNWRPLPCEGNVITTTLLKHRIVQNYE